MANNNMNKTESSDQNLSESEEENDLDEQQSIQLSQNSSVQGAEHWMKKLINPNPRGIEVLGMTNSTDDKCPPMLPLIALPSVPLSSEHHVSLENMKIIVRFCQKLAQWNKGQLASDPEIDSIMYRLSNSETIGYKRPRS